MATFDEITSFSIEISMQDHATGATGHSGWTKRVAGRKDLTCSFEALGYEAAPEARANDEKDIVITLFTGVTFTMNNLLTQSVSQTTEIDSGAPVGYSYEFAQGDGTALATAVTGALTRTTSTGVTVTIA